LGGIGQQPTAPKKPISQVSFVLHFPFDFSFSFSFLSHFDSAYYFASIEFTESDGSRKTCRSHEEIRSSRFVFTSLHYVLGKEIELCYFCSKCFQSTHVQELWPSQRLAFQWHEKLG
jgi:hypothetical protein